MADKLDFVFNLIDQASGPAEKIASGLGGVNSALRDVDRGAGKMGKLEKTAHIASIGANSILAANGVVQLTKAFGGFDKIKGGIMRAGAALKALGGQVLQAGKKIAPFAIGGAGLYGLAKVAGSIAIPAMGGVALAIGGVSIAAVAASAAVGGLVAKLSYDITSATIGAGAFREQMTMAFAALNEGDDGAARLDRIRMISNEMGTSFKDTAMQFRGLFAKGFNPAQAEELFLRMQDMKGIAGLTEDQMGRALLAIGQIKNTGKLQGDELNQLADAGIPVSKVYEELGKAAGKSVPEIMKMKEAGQIDDSMAVGAIMAAIGGIVGSDVAGEVGKKIADTTLRGMWTQFKNKPTGFLDDLAKKTQPQIEKLKPILGDLLGAVKGGGAATWTDAIAGGIGKILDVAVAAWPAAKAFMNGLSEGMGAAWKSISAAFGGGANSSVSFADRITELLPVFQAVGNGLGKLIVFTGAFGSAVLAFGGAFFAFGGFVASGVGSMVERVFWLGGAFTSVGAQILGAFSGLSGEVLRIAGGVIDGLVVALENGYTRVAAAARQLASAIPGPMRWALGIASPSKVTYGFGTNVGRGLELGMGASARRVERASLSLGASVTSGFGPNSFSGLRSPASAAMGAPPVMMPSPVASPAAMSAASGGRGASTVIVNLNVQAGPGASKQDAQNLGDELEPLIERIVWRSLEGASLQLGN